MKEIKCFVLYNSRKSSYLRTYALNSYLEPDFYWTKNPLESLKVLDFNRLRILKKTIPSRVSKHLQVFEVSASMSHVGSYSDCMSYSPSTPCG